MKEMVGGCCVCSDERGWPDNPLVYCDGNGCTVAVHQACYGIVTVPIGPWFCRKCESPDRQAKVRCELCPSRSGALKRVDTGGWAHVVCALYIPEVRFGNVTSMEPIILQIIPPERYNKTCYICQEMGKVSRASVGACMQCNKAGCKQQFHVTCAQSLGLLCEEAGNYLDNVKYCGYCQHHYSKLKKGGNVKTIPPYKPISQDSHSSDSSPEKEGDATTSGGSVLSSTVTTVISAPTLSVPTTTAPKNLTSKSSNAGRKSSTQQATVALPKMNFLNMRMTTSTTPTHSTAAVTTSSTTKVQSEAVPSTSKSSTGLEKSGSKRWSMSPSPSSTEVRSLSSSSSSSNSISNTQLIELPSSSESGSVPLSPALLPKVKMQKFSNKSGSLPKASVVLTNANIPALTNTGMAVSSTLVTQHQSEQSFSSSEVKEKMESDVYNMPVDIKQTKKKKALQNTAQDLSLHGNETSTTSSGTRDRSYASGDRIPDSTNEEKLKKLKTDVSSGSSKSNTSAQPSNVSTGLNIQMEPNLSSMPHPAHASTSSTHTLSTTGLGPSSLTTQSQAYLPERTSSSHPMSNVGHSGGEMSNISHTISSHIQSNPGKIQDLNPPEIPSSLVVSVPLSQSGQGLNLSQNSNTIDLVSQPSSPQAPSGNWGLKIAYEPQIPAQPQHSSKMVTDPDTLYPIPKRLRVESIDITGKSNIKTQGAIIIDSIDKMASLATGGIRNKKRAAMNIPPPTSSLSAVNAANSLQAGLSKRHQVTPPPSTSTMYHESPPRSPGSEIRSKSSKSNIQRLGRAPHMLGNELNPDSAVAARLSEQLSAELAAHSVFRAPSPLVPPPLINRATSGGRAPITGSNTTIGLGTGGAQSLDQLLERQWEQGSQFLMEQAQHFDIASLLSCLHQLRSENVNLEEHVGALTERRDHLLAVNARLAIPLNSVTSQGSAESNKMTRDPNIIRQPPPSQHQRTDVLSADRSQQLMMRDHQPKPS